MSSSAISNNSTKSPPFLTALPDELIELIYMNLPLNEALDLYKIMDVNLRKDRATQIATCFPLTVNTPGISKLVTLINSYAGPASHSFVQSFIQTGSPNELSKLLVKAGNSGRIDDVMKIATRRPDCLLDDVDMALEKHTTDRYSYFG